MTPAVEYPELFGIPLNELVALCGIWILLNGGAIFLYVMGMEMDFGERLRCPIQKTALVLLCLSAGMFLCVSWLIACVIYGPKQVYKFLDRWIEECNVGFKEAKCDGPQD